MEHQTLKEKTAKGFLWGGISNGMTQLLAALFGIFLARILDAEDYGMIGMLTIFSLIANAIQESGFTAALTNRKEIAHKDYNAVFWFSLSVASFLYVLLFFSAPLIADFFNQPALTDLARYQFLGFLISSAGTAHYALIYKKMQVKTHAKISITALVISGIVGVLMAYYGMAYWGLATQNLLYITISTILRWFYSGWRPTFTFDFTPIKEMWPFSVKILLTSITNAVNNNLFTIILGRYYEKTDVGHYTQGNKWMAMGQSTVVGMVNNVVQPLFAQVTDDNERTERIFRKVLRMVSFITFPLMLGLAFIAEEFIVITIGQKWLPAVPFLQLLCISGSIWSIIQLYAQFSLSRGKSNLYFGFAISFSVFQLVVALVMIRWGIFPMLIAYVCNYFILLVAWQLATRKYTQVSNWNSMRDILPFLLVTLLVLALTYFITLPIHNIYILLVAKILVAACLYLLIMKLFKSVILQEIIVFIKGRVSSKR